MRHAARWFGACASIVLVGCHTYVPVDAGPPPAGERFAFHISDQGRVGLQDRLGPGVVTINGRLMSVEDNVFLVSVASVEQLNGTSTRWADEVMRLDQNFVARLQRREFSRTRTFLLAGGITAATVAFIATRGFSAIFGDEDGDDREPPPVEKRGRPFRP